MNGIDRGSVINAHGGALNTDAGSLAENIPVVCLSGIKVIAVKYRLAPETPSRQVQRTQLRCTGKYSRTTSPRTLDFTAPRREQR